MALAVDRMQEQPFKRHGLGWQFRPPQAQVVMTFTNVQERRGEVRAELHVETASGGHMLRRYLNLLGSSSVRELAKDLAAADGGAGFPWAAIIESATESIIRAVRVGPTLETYQGEIRRPAGIRWLCDGLVMADVPNVWIAAGSTGKSTFSVGLAVHHSMGAPFLGRETSRGVPLYLDWESTADDFEEKLWLISRSLGQRSVPRIHRMRMAGAATGYAPAIANRIDDLGATLVIWDGIQAAGGPISQSAGYEAVAGDLEALVGSLPVTTHLMLDHVTGDDLKTGAVPLKARGSTRKVEWARNQWTLVLDRDAQRDERHVVGWTHTKINRSKYAVAFGVEVLHREDELGFRLLEESEVEPLRERMSDKHQLLAVLAGQAAVTVEQAALWWLGSSDKRSQERVLSVVRKDNGKLIKQFGDGTLTQMTPELQPKMRRAAGRPNLRAVAREEEPPPDWPDDGVEWADDELP
jgi:hypothetical protein